MRTIKNNGVAEHLEAINITARIFNRDAGTVEQMRKTRTIPFIASTADKDRHGTILNQDNWDLEGFRLNPVIGYQHQLHPDMCIKATPDDVIGKGMNVRVSRDEQTGKTLLLLEIWFEDEETNPLAEKVFRKLLNGTLNAVSVGFYPLLVNGEESRKGNPANGEDPEAEYMFGQELLEVSVVNIPSNKFAVQKAVSDTVANALLFCRNQLGKSFAEIEAMTVRQVIDGIQSNRVAPTVNIEEVKDEAAEMLAKRLANIKPNEKAGQPAAEAQASEAAGEAVGDIEMMELELKLKRNKQKLN